MPGTPARPDRATGNAPLRNKSAGSGRAGAGASPLPLFFFSVPARSLTSSAMRRAARAQLELAGLNADTIEDVLLVLSELCSNAVEASPETSPIDATIDRIDEEALLVSVRNTGPGFDPDPLVMPEASQVGGRGVAIARLIGEFGVSQSGTRTTVTVRIPSEARRPHAARPDGG